MTAWLKLSSTIDKFSDFFAVIAKWTVLASCLISALNAFVRYLFAFSSNGFLEIQWYLFAACVMLGAAKVLRVNEHVRVDVFYGRYKGKTQALIDLLGLVFFLFPVMVVMISYSFPLFMKMLQTGEMSSNAGGLIRWPAMMLLPVGFTLVLLQGCSEIIKRIAWLGGKYQGEFQYERPLQ